MSTCRKCNNSLEDGWICCPVCGAKQTKPAPAKRQKNANGDGCIYKRGKTYTARIVIGYELRNGRKFAIVATKGGFKTKREAKDAMPGIKAAAIEARAKPRRTVDYSAATFKELYEKFLPRHAERVGKSTINCYKSAYKYYADIYNLPFADLNTEDFQLCVDDCPHGIRTKQNMKALGTLMYKYAAELRIFGVSTGTDFASLVWLPSEDTESRHPFTLGEVQMIKDGVAQGIRWADWILAMCYTGFRPSEFLDLEKDAFDPQAWTLRGGAKTAAGKNRIVPVHPLIRSFIAQQFFSCKKYLFELDGKRVTLNHFRENMFYPALAAMGIQPIPDRDSGEKPERTPYSTRHTFSTLMKDVPGSAKDKAALMGHTSYEMTLHYQHEDYDSLRNIVNQMA